MSICLGVSEMTAQDKFSGKDTGVRSAARTSGSKMRRTGMGALAALVVTLAALIPIATRARAQAAAPAPNSYALGHSVVVIGPNSPMFDTLLERWFPGVTNVNYFKEIKPLLAIVHNNTKRPVKAYVIKWAITNSDGSTSTALLPVMQEPLEPWGPPGARTVLGPAGTGRGSELVSPFFGWTRKGFDTLEPAGLVSIPFSSAARNPLVSAAQNASSVQVVLDGAIFGDGVFVGADTSKLYERFQAEQEAQVEEEAWIAKELGVGAPAQTIRDGLSKQIYAGVNAAGMSSASLSAAALGRRASRFLRLLDKSGEAALQKAVAIEPKPSPLVLRRQSGG